MGNCHYEYKGLKYDELSDLYSVIKGEQETKDSPVKVTADSVTITRKALSDFNKKSSKVASKVEDLKTRDEIQNLTQYKMNTFVRKILLNTPFVDAPSVAKEYLIRGNKITRGSVASAVFGREEHEIAKQLKSSNWATLINGGKSIDEAANSIANDSESDYGVKLDVSDLSDALIDIIPSFTSMKDLKLDLIERYLDATNPGWDKQDSTPTNILSFIEFGKVFTPTEHDIEGAMYSMSNGDLIVGKRLTTNNGDIVIQNVSPDSAEVFSVYVPDTEDLKIDYLTPEVVANIYAYNIAYEHYLAGNLDISNTPSTLEGVEVEIKIPTKEDALAYEDYPQESTPFLSGTTELSFNSYGYDENNDDLSNINNSLKNIASTSEDPVLRYIANKYLQNINTFEGLPFILDNDLDTYGRATYRKGDSTSIRINPSLINDKATYQRTLIEELTHSLVKKESLNGGSETNKRLRDLWDQAKSAYGKENLSYIESSNYILQDFREIERSGGDLTPEQQQQKDNLIEERKNHNLKLAYALNDFDEFIAHIGVNRDLQNFLNNIKETDTQKSLYQKFVDIILNLLSELGINIDNKGIFKYAIHDLFNLIDDSIENSNIGRSLLAKEARSKVFINNKLGLRTADNSFVPISNVEEVRNFINATYSNVVAIADWDNKTINLKYRDELNSKDLKDLDTEVLDSIKNTLARKGDEFSSAFYDDEDSDFDYHIEANDYNDTVKEFRLQQKIYLANLNDREHSLKKSLNRALASDVKTKLDKDLQANKVNSIEQQIDEVRDTMKRITSNSTNVRPFNNLVDIAYNGRDELNKITNMIEMSKAANVTNTHNNSFGTQYIPRVLSSSDIAYMLQTIMFWKNAKQAFFIEDNYKDKDMDAFYNELQHHADTVQKQIEPILDLYTIEREVKPNTKFNGTIDELAKEFSDLNGVEKLVNSLNNTDSSLLQAIGIKIKKQNEIRGDEVFDKVKAFEAVAKKAIPDLKSMSTDKDNAHDIFIQRDNFGRKTKNIVSRYSYGYQQARKSALGFVYNKNSERTAEQAQKALTFLNDETHAVKYSVLFPLKQEDFNQEAFDKESARLKEIMGSNHYTEWFGKQSKYIEDFKKYRDFKVHDIMTKFDLESEEDIFTDTIADKEYTRFMELNSPYLLEVKLEQFYKNEKENKSKRDALEKDRLKVLDDIFKQYGYTTLQEVYDDNNSKSDYIRYLKKSNHEVMMKNYNIQKRSFTALKGYNVFKYIEDIPKKTYMDGGKEMASYDVAFDRIEKNLSVYNYYNAINNALKDVGDMIDYETGDKIAKGGLPEFKLAMYSMFMKDGKRVALDAFTTSMYNMIRSDKTLKKDMKIDIITGKEKQKIPTGLYSSKSAINNEIDLRIVSYKNETGHLPSQSLIEDWKSEVTEQYVNKMELDLSKVIPMYITLGVAYKHKASIEDDLMVVKETFNNMREFERDNQGNFVADPMDNSGATYKRKETRDSYKNAKELLEGTYSANLYGNTRDVNLGKTKILSPEEKRDKKNIENLIAELEQAYKDKKYDTDEYLEWKKTLNDKIDSLGAYHDKQKNWDPVLTINQWRGMGWNILGGISNSLFGYASNLVESAGGEFYTTDNLMKAYAKVYKHSFVKNMTFNKYGGSEARKIRSLMDRYTILSEGGAEYRSMVENGDLTERMKWASGFNMNARTEYINQAPLMLVVFENTPFTYEGKDYMLYEGFNEDGTWNKDEFGEYPQELANKATLKVKSLIERNHGNYNPMSPILAKRTGLGRLLMQFRTWMVEGVRVRLGDRKARTDEVWDVQVRGRYWSAYDLFRNDWKGTTINTALQVLKNFLAIGNNKFKNFTPLDKYAQGNENLEPVDIANMKRVAMELNILIGMTMTMIALKALASGFDNDDPRKWALMIAINQGQRLKTDVLMYINPLEAKKIIQDPIPAMKLLTDVSKFLDAGQKTVFEGSPDYTTGVYAGHSRLFKSFVSLFPGTAQGYRTLGQATQDFSEK